MRYLLLAIPAAFVAALLSGTALARSEAPPKAPQGLEPFLLRADEPTTHEFPRTPSFSWRPVRGAVRYEFQLAKSPSFGDGAILWSSKFVKAPAVAVPLALPWMTGNPYAAYARVRAVTRDGVTGWSKPFGFNIRWTQVPQKEPDYPGLSRWTPVEGATAYDVWFTRIGPGWSKTVRTRTNAVDHREAYAFHDDPSWTGEVRFRVRAVRIIYGEIPSGLPAVSYGPWSREFVSRNTPQTGSLKAAAAITSGAVSKQGAARPHELTPAFSFRGRLETTPGATTGAGLYRVYIATDRDCVNVVFRGPAVGSPGYAPRMTGTLALPASAEELEQAKVEILADGEEGETYGADNLPFTSSEAPVAADGGTGSEGSGDANDGAPQATPLVNGAKVDLWESGWPNGRFYWTVVPVTLVQKDGDSSFSYRDLVTPQDQCQRGNVVAFGKQSAPVVAGTKAPFASGLSPEGRLVAGGKQARFFGSPIVAWRPVLGAESYEIEWSKARYPWRTVGKAKTFGTAATLPLKPGTWWYRIRGVNPALPGTASAMGWSTPLRLTIAAPRFTVRGGR